MGRAYASLNEKGQIYQIGHKSLTSPYRWEVYSNIPKTLWMDWTLLIMKQEWTKLNSYYLGLTILKGLEGEPFSKISPSYNVVFVFQKHLNLDGYRHTGMNKQTQSL